MKTIKKCKAIKQYKIFYKDEDGRLYCKPEEDKFYYEVGKEYKSKKVNLCKAGFHSCKKLTDCLSYYPLSASVVYAEVEIWGAIEEKYDKTASKYIKIVKILSFKETQKIFEEENGSLIINSKNILNSDLINKSHNIMRGVITDYSFNVDNSSRIIKSENVSNSDEILKSSLIHYSNSIIRSRLVESSERVRCSYIIDNSNNIESSENIKNSNNILNCICIYYSDIIINSKVIYNSYFIRKCSALSSCLFCYDISSKQNYLFNKEVSADRIEEIANKLYKYLDLYKSDVPVKFNNFQKIKTKYKKDLPLEAVNSIDISFNIHKDFLEYIKKLPEFDNKIWQEIIKK